MKNTNKLAVLLGAFLLFSSFSANAYLENDVRNYGAIPNDGVDDTTAFKQAIANSKGAIFVPSGTFNLSQTLKLLGGKTSIRGNGKYSTTLRFSRIDYANTAILCTPRATQDKCSLSDLTVTYAGTAPTMSMAYFYNGTPTVSYDAHSGKMTIKPRTFARLKIHDVRVTNFYNGIRARSVLGPDFKNLTLQGKGLTKANSFGILIYGNGETAEGIVDGGNITNYQSGVISHDFEGLYIKNSYINYVVRGLTVRNNRTEPQVQVYDSYIRATFAPIDLQTSAQVNIHNNNLRLFKHGGLTYPRIYGILHRKTYSTNSIRDNSIVAEASVAGRPHTLTHITTIHTAGLVIKGNAYTKRAGGTYRYEHKLQSGYVLHTRIYNNTYN